MLITDATFHALSPAARFGLSAVVLFGAAYGVAQINEAAGVTLAAIFAGVFLFYGGAIAGH